MKTTIRKLALLLIAAAAVLLSGCSRNDRDAIVGAQANEKLISQMETNKFLTAAQASQWRGYVHREAERAVGQKLDPHKVSSWGKFLGFFTTLRVIMIFAGIVAVGSLAWILKEFLAIILLNIPKVCWELLCWGIVLGGLFFIRDIWFAFPAALCVIPVCFLSLYLHVKNKDGNPTTFVATVCLILWSIAAVHQQSAILAFMAVLAFEVLLGFGVAADHLSIGIGFEKEDKIPSATLASLLLLLFGVFSAKVQMDPEVHRYLALFENGLLWLGTGIYFLGLLILSSRYYGDSGKRNNYWPLQLAVIASGIVAIVAGNHLDLSMLAGVGGTFFALYLVQKWVELTITKHVATSLLIASGLVYGLTFVAKAYPKYFLFF